MQLQPPRRHLAYVAVVSAGTDVLVPAISSHWSTGSVVRPAGITYEKMALAGKKVKRVLDYGRLLWLRDELGLDARMVRYCDTELSPECWLLVNQAREEE